MKSVRHVQYTKRLILAYSFYFLIVYNLDLDFNFYILTSKMFGFDLFCAIIYFLSDFFLLFPIFYRLILLEHGGFGLSGGIL